MAIQVNPKLSTMAIRVNPKLIDDIAKYGAADVWKCYHCGNCSAACPFSKDPFVIPRRSMRHLQMGLEEKLRETLEPWLCYYCGECSQQCPRGAEPGETMMSLRRWLTSRYDATGIARLFYKSWKTELLVIILVSLATAFGFLVLGFTVGGGDWGVYTGAGALFPDHYVHYIDLALAGLLASLLVTNAGRMWWFTTGRHQRELGIPLSTYLKHLVLLPYHYLTQARYSQCEKKSPWLIHLGIFASWVTMEVLIILFLEHMHRAETFWTAHAFGYLATIGLIGGTFYAMVGRWRKQATHYKHTHATDWMFLGLIAATATTGILQHAAYRWFGLDQMANIVYLVHMMFVVPLLAVQIPFSKLSHLAYRPLAMYFAAVQKEALLQRQAAVEPVEAVKLAT